MPSMQRFELSLNDMTRLLTREPLLIVRLSILKPGLQNTMRPVRKKPYQDHIFAFRIPLELDGDGLDLLKLDHLSWLHLLGEVLRIARWSLVNCSPILHSRRDSSRNIFIWPLSPNGHPASSIWYLLDAYLEVALLTWSIIESILLFL
jgi:hypothetical protein